MLSEAYLTRKAASSTITSECRHSTIALSKIQVKQSLTLCSPLFFGWGNESVNHILSYNADKHIHFGVMWQCSPLIVECERLKIIDAPLTLIFRMGK